MPLRRDTLLDLSSAAILAPADLIGPELKAAAMLADEVAKRTRIRLPVVHEWPSNAVPVIVVGSAATLAAFGPQYAAAFDSEEGAQKPEGYRIRVTQNGAAPVVWVVGNDA